MAAITQSESTVPWDGHHHGAQFERDLLAAGRSLDASIARDAQRMENGNAGNLLATVPAVSDA
jgi:hypothetical protein